MIDLPRITGQDLLEVARAERSTAGGLGGWAWNEVKALSLPWFSGLAILLNMVELTGDWPQGLLEAYVAMILKADGDSTPWVSVPLVSCLWCTGCGHPSGFPILRSGCKVGFFSRCSVSVTVCLQLRLGFQLRWILKRSWPGLGVIICMSWLLVSFIKSFGTVDRSL